MGAEEAVGVDILLPDIKALTTEQPNLLQQAQSAFVKHNEEQLTTTKLPGGSQDVSHSIGNRSNLNFDVYVGPCDTVQLDT